MNLYEEAERITLGGISFYRFGFFVMLGMIAAAAVISFLSWARRARKGTAPVLLLSSVLLGGLCSRLFYCLLDLDLEMPFSWWFRITSGGWSMMGLAAGVLLAAWLTAKITGQKAGLTLDLAACALPAFMALERAGEGGVPGFDFSRRLTTGLLENTFLSFSDYDGSYLATWKLASIVMLLLIPVLILDLTRSRRDGNTCLLFLLLFGGCSVILESLRYDQFMTVKSFVGLQHVLAAVFLAAGVYTSAFRAARKKTGILLGTLLGAAAAGAAALLMVFWIVEHPAVLTATICIFFAGALLAAVLSVTETKHGNSISGLASFCMTASAGIAIALEFAIDRSTFNKLVIYILYLLVMAVPVLQGILMRGADARKL